MLQDWKNPLFGGMPKLQTLSIADNNIKVPLFKGLQNLTYLDMGKNKPISLNSTPFRELNNLERLYLGSCHIRELRASMFTGLINLLVLNLDGNRLQYLHTDLFDRLTKLKLLRLNRNPLYFSTSFPAHIFHPLAIPEELNLDGIYKGVNLPANYTYLDEQLKRVPSLKSLCIDGVPNKKFGPGFTALKNLNTIFISGNLSEINNETFYNLRYTRSLTIKLYGCTISSILAHPFTPIRNLTTLDVSGTLSLCDNGIWYNLTAGLRSTNLKHMIARNICLVGVPFIKRWWNLPELESLDLSVNTLEYIDFSRLPVSLKTINLRRNGIFTIDGLDKLRNLRKLDLSDQIRVVEKSHVPTAHLKANLKGEVNLINGNMTDQHLLDKMTSTSLYKVTKMKRTDLNKTGQHVAFNTGTKQSKGQMSLSNAIPPFLEWINVRESALFCFLLEYNNTINSIKVLKGSRIALNHCITNGKLWSWLANLIMLEDLDLSANQIRSIPTGAFSNQKRLKYSYLYDNSLVTLTFEIRSVVDLKEIYLSRNQIQYASSSFTTAVELHAKHSDLKLYLDGNDLVCNCEQKRFAGWLLTSNAIHNKMKLLCKYENVIVLSYISK